MKYQKVHPRINTQIAKGNPYLERFTQALDRWYMIEPLLCESSIVFCVCPICANKSRADLYAYAAPVDNTFSRVRLSPEKFRMPGVIAVHDELIYVGDCDKCGAILWFPASIDSRSYDASDYLRMSGEMVAK